MGACVLAFVGGSEMTVMRLTMPSRTLTDQRKPAKYVPAAMTDIRATFAKYARLERIKKLEEQRAALGMGAV
jgi:hypothetical protein